MNHIRIYCRFIFNDEKTLDFGALLYAVYKKICVIMKKYVDKIINFPYT